MKTLALSLFVCGCCQLVVGIYGLSNDEPTPAIDEPDKKLSEVDHCKRLAAKYNAELEVRQFDGSRVDLLTDQHAIEVDWARKWAEGVGQASLYAELTGKQPALLLLVDPQSESDKRYIWRARVACARNRIRVFVEAIK